jgi:hypothetical protein
VPEEHVLSRGRAQKVKKLVRKMEKSTGPITRAIIPTTPYRGRVPALRSLLEGAPLPATGQITTMAEWRDWHHLGGERPPAVDDGGVDETRTRDLRRDRP